jgi:hypothetical protein
VARKEDELSFRAFGFNLMHQFNTTGYRHFYVQNRYIEATVL